MFSDFGGNGETECFMGGELVETGRAIWATSSLVEKFNLVSKEYT